MAISTAKSWKTDENGRSTVDVIETTYEGAVLFEWEENHYNDSDFKAAVWDADTQTVKTIEWATTRFPTIGYGYGCEVDATPEVWAAVEKAYRPRAFHNLVARFIIEAQQPAKGKRVRIVRGTKKNPTGMEGEVFWLKEQRSQYGTWGYGTRLGLKGEDGETYWTDGHRVEVVGWEDLMPDLSELESRVEGITATPSGFYRAYRVGLV